MARGGAAIDANNEIERGSSSSISGNVSIDEGGGHDVNAKLTMLVVISCIVAASGGLIFGYDLGVTGGVTTMEPFLRKFFPSVLEKKAEGHDMYCVFNSQILTAFTSSLYIAGLVSSLVAGRLAASKGRKNTMIIGGFIFLVGTTIGAFAQNVPMLISSRILLGFGIGFTNQVTPLYLAEMAPPKWRGAFNTGFQFFMGIGVLSAAIVNVFVAGTGESAWRIALAVGGVPAIIMTVGALLIPDTPNSLIERGKLAQARQALTKVRGVDSDVEAELNELVISSKAVKAVNQEPFKLIFQRKYRPQLVWSTAIAILQQFSGINGIAFYAPILFQSIGYGPSSALMGAVILGLVNLASILVSTYAVDRFGRRALFLEGGVQMIICQVAVSILLKTSQETSGDSPFSKDNASIITVLLALFAAGFGWSWGPLTYLIPSEISPTEIRPAAQGICVSLNFLATFVLAQAFLPMLCHFRNFIFLFYASWIVLMTVAVAIFLPETKGIPLRNVHKIWEEHWYWRRFVL